MPRFAVARVARTIAGSARRNPLLFGGAVLLGAAGYAYKRHADERRGSIERDDLRELSDMWTWVDDLCWFARLSAQGHEHSHPPVVLVHGFGISSAYFVPLAERLAPHFDVYAPDLPGHGHSETPYAPLDVVGLADALGRWLEAMRIARASLVGNSMGCQVAAELAARRPEVVDRLVLIAPTMNDETRSLARVLPRFVVGSLHERSSMALLLARDYARMGVRLVDELQAMFDHPIEATLPRVEAPVLLMRGEHDKVVTQRWIEALAQRVRCGRTLVVSGQGHAVHYSAADECVHLLRPFLEEAAETASRGQ